MIDLPALITKCRALGHYSQFGDSGQNIDKAASDSVAEVFILRVATCVFERQDCKRINDLRDSLWAEGTRVRRRIPRALFRGGLQMARRGYRNGLRVWWRNSPDGIGASLQPLQISAYVGRVLIAL